MRISNLQQRLIGVWEALSRGTDLKFKAARGGVWLGAGSAVEHTLRLLRNIILVRLIAPDAFGLMALVVAANALLQSFTEMGIQDAVIQNPRSEQKTYLNAAWWLALARSTALYVVAYFAAPFLAGFYENPDLVPMIRVAFIGGLFEGAISPAVYVALKKTRFRPWVVLQTGGASCGTLAAVLLALAIPGVWALVIGHVIESAARCVLSYVTCPYRPGTSTDQESIRALLKFSRGYFGLPALTFFYLRADVFVIGKLSAAAALGIYAMAATLARIPYQLVGQTTNLVFGPVFSELQSDANRMNRVLVKITSALALLALPLLVCLSLCAQSVLHLVYGPAYAQASLPFTLLLFGTFFQLMTLPIAKLYLMVGRPDLHRYFGLIRATVLLILIYPGVLWFGLAGAAGAGLIAMGVAYYFQVLRLRSLIGLNIPLYASAFSPAVTTAAVVMVLWATTRVLFESRPALDVILGALACLSAYALACAAFLFGARGRQLSFLTRWLVS